MADQPLTGWSVAGQVQGAASRYAGELLRGLGARLGGAGRGITIRAAADSGAAADWAASGAQELTGYADGPALPAPGSPATAARGAGLAFEALAGPVVGADGHLLLAERAALLGLARRAPWSAGGGCRAVPTRTGWVAVSLSRPDDVAAVGALTGSSGCEEEPWRAVESWAATRAGLAVVERAQLLGIPAARIPAAPPLSRPEFGAGGRGPSSLPRRSVPWRLSSCPGGAFPVRPLVVDLSSLWAGPLCASLLGRSGAEVVRVESVQRPDGGRGHRSFDDLLHGDQASVAVDLGRERGRRQLQELVAVADVVVTSARRRALEQLGLDPARYLDRRPYGVWVSVTAHPRRSDGSEWVGFGDDAAMAAGLVVRDESGRPLPCGDAIADPLTGLHAALVALSAVRGGGRHHAELNLHDVAASTLRPAPGPPPGPARPPVARARVGRSHRLGADSERILAEIAWRTSQAKEPLR